MNELERKIVTALKDPLYTIEFLESRIDRDDNVLINGTESLDKLAIDLLEVANDNMFGIESIKIGNQPFFEVKKGFFNVNLKALIKQEGDDK